MSGKIFFNDSFTYRLNVLAGAAIDSGEEAFGALVGGSIREIRVLRVVGDHPGITFAEITRATRLERSLVSRLIQSLLRLGLIERRGASEDARRYQLYVTELGQARRAKADRITQAFERVILAPLAPGEVARLNAALETLGRWVASEDYAEAVIALRREFDAEED